MFLLFDIQTGVSGDMILAALFDMGLDFKAWKNQMDGLGLPSLNLEATKVLKHGISATSFQGHFPHEHHHRGLKTIHEIVSGSSLSPSVKSQAMRVFTRLAEVEAKIHGVEIDQVHFHEVGALDAIVDIVGACLGFEMLQVHQFYTTPLTFGTGTVNTEHGILSVPVPATLALSQGFPSLRTTYPGELCTPTGTALVTTLAKPLPPGLVATLSRQGYGAGTRNLPGTANVLRICLMDVTPGAAPLPQAAAPNQEEDSTVFQVECNLDNMSPELIGYLAEKLLAWGCKDVWQEPIFMKKNRAATKLAALVAKDKMDAILNLIAAETFTGGIRYFQVNRLVSEKSQATAALPFGSVILKGVKFPGMDQPRFTPEYESCRQWAEVTGLSLTEIYRQTFLAIQDLNFAAHESAATKPRLKP